VEWVKNIRLENDSQIVAEVDNIRDKTVLDKLIIGQKNSSC